MLVRPGEAGAHSRPEPGVAEAVFASALLAGALQPRQRVRSPLRRASLPRPRGGHGGAAAAALGGRGPGRQPGRCGSGPLSCLCGALRGQGRHGALATRPRWWAVLPRRRPGVLRLHRAADGRRRRGRARRRGPTAPAALAAAPAARSLVQSEPVFAATPLLGAAQAPAHSLRLCRFQVIHGGPGGNLPRRSVLSVLGQPRDGVRRCQVPPDGPGHLSGFERLQQLAHGAGQQDLCLRNRWPPRGRWCLRRRRRGRLCRRWIHGHRRHQSRLWGLRWRWRRLRRPRPRWRPRGGREPGPRSRQQLHGLGGTV
mmetsp:Transcript_1121/g.3462  ORF Transcript_1121/g.3462 Transcript_1121/m.3462 type:complete len:312 (+) Transcript_1121:879-1814(+)